MEFNTPENANNIRQKFAQDNVEASSEIDSDLLVDKLGRTLAWLMRDISRLYTGIGQKTLHPWGITMAHWYYLRVLESGPLNQLELSKRVGMASATTVPVLDFLEKSELVLRVRDPNDRRKYNVTLTDNGRRLIGEVMSSFTQLVKESFEGASPNDIKIVWKTLLQVEANLLAVNADDNADY
ncbi:MarR family winged helix-turn-helix transcriptional regulator [Ferribacterium limneticum]|uniref:MarR family winged helix-turn-helix transcriptional regulator n=1 Tax=Ferribacterium limneticum TaxID=76259 RepID=UPI001CFBD858|nr:MarR family transcriptional regulator [Ferribacterium limneticum]UCV17784.1 MarR family transcriptional regulator [Ferribacterium limneticum]